MHQLVFDIGKETENHIPYTVYISKEQHGGVGDKDPKSVTLWGGGWVEGTGEENWVISEQPYSLLP